MQKKLKNNLLSLCIDEFDENEFPSDILAFCKFDLYILFQFIKLLGVKKITEFGYGLSSKIMSEVGLDVTSFSLGISDAGVKSKVNKTKFIQCNLYDKSFRKQILQSCMQADLIVIDCEHSYEMAEYYSEQFLNKCLKPVFIHDMTGPYRGNIENEQGYIEKYLIKNTNDVFAYTDIQNYSDIFEKIGKFKTKRIC